MHTYDLLYVYDLDGTLIIQEDVKTAMTAFRRRYGYLPKGNWLMTPESLRDVKLNPIMSEVIAQSNSLQGLDDHVARVCVISNRSETMLGPIMRLMQRLNIKVDDYLLKPSAQGSPLMSKSARLRREMDRFNFNMVYVYDDDIRSINDFESIRPYMQSLTSDYTVVHVSD